MQEKLAKVLSEIAHATDVARALMLEMPSEDERTEAIQATIALATKIIETCTEASKEHRIAFSLLDHTMRFDGSTAELARRLLDRVGKETP